LTRGFERKQLDGRNGEPIFRIGLSLYFNAAAAFRALNHSDQIVD
jgi:hypothetical protein